MVRDSFHWDAVAGQDGQVAGGIAGGDDMSVDIALARQDAVGIEVQEEDRAVLAAGGGHSKPDEGDDNLAEDGKDTVVAAVAGDGHGVAAKHDDGAEERGHDLVLESALAVLDRLVHFRSKPVVSDDTP